MVDGNRSTRHSNTLECRYAVLTAVMNDHKCKDPRPRSGMDYIRGVLRGSHLLAHTWAVKPMQICCLPMQTPPNTIIKKLYHNYGGSSICSGHFWRKKPGLQAPAFAVIST